MQKRLTKIGGAGSSNDLIKVIVDSQLLTGSVQMPRVSQWYSICVKARP